VIQDFNYDITMPWLTMRLSRLFLTRLFLREYIITGPTIVIQLWSSKFCGHEL